MTRLMLAAGLALLLAACSSTSLDTPAPVEDRKPATGQPATTQADQSRVTGVTAGGTGADTAGPRAEQRVVRFDFDSYVIKPEYQPVIETNARYIKANPGRKVSIEGHTDEQGGREYNLALGQRRAEAVRRALTLLGVADSQLEAVSFGKEKPLAQGSDEGARAQNRRAEITYR